MSIKVPFFGSSYPKVDSTTIFQYRGDVDGSGNLIDWSGENLLSYSEDFTQYPWTTQKATITSNAIKNPITNTLTADISHENTQTGFHGVWYQILTTIGHIYTISAYFKAINRTWAYLGFEDPGVAGVYFNLSGNGSVGTSAAGMVGRIQALGGGWYRCSNTYTVTTVNPYIDIVSASGDSAINYTGTDIDSLYIFGAQLVDNTDGYITGPGRYKATGAIAKPRLDLSPTGSPTSGYSDLQLSSGSRMGSRVFNGATQYYSRAHHASMNVFDGDLVLTFVIAKSASSAGEDMFFSHTDGSSNGIYLETVNPTAAYRAVFLESGTYQVVTGPTVSYNDNTYNIVQLLRSSGTATLYVNGVAGTPVAVTGGVDGSVSMYLGALDNVPNYPWQGSILYAQLDPRALSATELAEQREKLWGIYSNFSPNTNWTFSRNSIGTYELADGVLATAPANVPRISGDVPRVGDKGTGVLIEGVGTNLYEYSETKCGNLGQLSSGTLAFGTDDIVSPNGLQIADSISDTSEAGPLSYVLGRDGVVSNLVSGTIYTLSLYIKKLPTATTIANSLDLRIVNGAHDSENVFNPSTGSWGTSGGTALISKSIQSVGNGWYRVSQTFTALANGNLYFVIYLNGGVSYTATGVAQIALWGGQCEASSFPTSYIPNLSTGTTSRARDSLTIPLHTAGSNKDLLPTLFGTDTNLALYSQDLNSWPIKTNATINNNAIAAPDGTMTADGIIEDIVDGEHYACTQADVVAGTVYTVSAYMKAGTRQWAGFSVYGVPTFDASFDLQNGVIGSRGASISNSTIESFGNGWYRCSMTLTSPTTATVYAGVWAAEADYDFSYTGTAGNTAVYIWGIQCEAGSSANPYIPTTTAAVTRAKAASKLTIQFDMKTEWSSSANRYGFIGIQKSDASLPGFRVNVDSDNKLYVYKGGDFMYTAAGVTTWQNWHTYKVFIDFADLSRSYIKIDGVAVDSKYGTWTGTDNFDTTTNSTLYVGYDRYVTAAGYCTIRGLVIKPEEF